MAIRWQELDGLEWPQVPGCWKMGTGARGAGAPVSRHVALPVPLQSPYSHSMIYSTHKLLWYFDASRVTMLVQYSFFFLELGICIAFRPKWVRLCSFSVHSVLCSPDKLQHKSYHHFHTFRSTTNQSTTTKAITTSQLQSPTAYTSSSVFSLKSYNHWSYSLGS